MSRPSRPSVPCASLSPTGPIVSRRAEATRSFASLPDQAGGKRTQDDSTTLFCGMLSAPPLQQYLIGRRRNTSANATPTAFSSPHDPICCTANCGQAGIHNWPLDTRLSRLLQGLDLHLSHVDRRTYERKLIQLHE